MPAAMSGVGQGRGAAKAMDENELFFGKTLTEQNQMDKQSWRTLRENLNTLKWSAVKGKIEEKNQSRKYWVATYF